MKGYVYIIQSVESGMFYTGSSTDLEERISRHNQNREKATKNRGPWILKFSQEYPTIQEAQQIEYRLKRLKNRNILEKIVENQKITIK